MLDISFLFALLWSSHLQPGRRDIPMIDTKVFTAALWSSPVISVQIEERTVNIMQVKDDVYIAILDDYGSFDPICKKHNLFAEGFCNWQHSYCVESICGTGERHPRIKYITRIGKPVNIYATQKVHSPRGDY